MIRAPAGGGAADRGLVRRRGFGVGLAFLCVLLGFLFWRATWFGRHLNDAEIRSYLGDEEKPRRIQHALVQISERLERGDAEAKRFHAQIMALRDHELETVRSTAAWVMGEDNAFKPFRQTLLGMLADPAPLVRFNAALSLSRFGEGQARSVLREMLEPYSIRAPAAGVVQVQLEVDEPVAPGMLLMRLATEKGHATEIRSPLAGRVKTRLTREGSPVAEGAEVMTLSPATRHVFEALRALYLVGREEDLHLVERYATGVPQTPAEVSAQARSTVSAIRAREAQ